MTKWEKFITSDAMMIVVHSIFAISCIGGLILSIMEFWPGIFLSVLFAFWFWVWIPTAHYKDLVKSERRIRKIFPTTYEEPEWLEARRPFWMKRRDI